MGETRGGSTQPLTPWSPPPKKCSCFYGGARTHPHLPPLGCGLLVFFVLFILVFAAGDKEDQLPAPGVGLGLGEK